MYLNAHIQVTVISNTTGDTIALKSICSVNKKQDGHALGAECELTVPMNCVIQYKDGQHDYLTQYTVNTQSAFSVGDQINITANYDGYPTQTIFNGFITDFVFNIFNEFSILKLLSVNNRPIICFTNKKLSSFSYLFDDNIL